MGWTGSTRRLYQRSAPKGCAQHRKIQLEPRGVFQSLNRHCSTADGYYCPLLKLYYSIFLSVALLPANPPWRDGRHSHIKLFMTLASALFCHMKVQLWQHKKEQSWLHQCSLLCLPVLRASAAPSDRTCRTSLFQRLMLFRGEAGSSGMREQVLQPGLHRGADSLCDLALSHLTSSASVVL